MIETTGRLIVCTFVLLGSGSVVAQDKADSDAVQIPIAFNVQIFSKIKTGHLLLSLKGKSPSEPRDVPDNGGGSHEPEVHDILEAPFVVDLGEYTKDFSQTLDVPEGKYEVNLFFSVKPSKHCTPKSSGFERQPSCTMNAGDRACASGQLDTNKAEHSLTLICG